MFEPFSTFEERMEYFTGDSRRLIDQQGRYYYQIWSLYVESIHCIPLIGPRMRYRLYLYEGMEMNHLHKNIDKSYFGRYATIHNYVGNGEAWIHDSNYGISFGKITSAKKLYEWLREKQNINL